MGSSKYICLSCLFVLCFVLFHIFLILKIDRTVDWHWLIIFIPFWGTAIGYSWLLLVLYDKHYRSLVYGLGGLLWTIGIAIAAVLFTILLSLKLENDPYWGTVNWGWIFVPLWTDADWPDYKMEFHRDYTKYRHEMGYRYLEVLPLNTLVSLAIFFIVIALRAQGPMEGTSWWICWGPLWYLTGVFVFIMITNITTFQSSRFKEHGWPFFVLLFFVAFEVLLILFLEGTIDRFVYCSIPLFVIEIITMCAPCWIWW